MSAVQCEVSTGAGGCPPRAERAWAARIQGRAHGRCGSMRCTAAGQGRARRNSCLVGGTSAWWIWAPPPRI
jgi:hypothetical protein